MNNKRILKWGIMGAGIIANKMADALRLTPNCQLHAIASKTLTRARLFAEKNGVKNVTADHFPGHAVVFKVKRPHKSPGIPGKLGIGLTAD